MALLHIPIDRISENDLNRLTRDKTPESTIIDFKRETYGTRDRDRTEFLSDISSFANTSGGDIIVGIAETQGIPTSLTPFTGDPDKEIRRLEDMARSGLQPRLSDLSIRALAVQGGWVLIVRTRRSFAGPHRVIYQGGSRFWARASTGKYEPDVDQLRRMFTEGRDFVQHIRDFRRERLIGITHQPFIQFHSPGRVIIHVIPVPAFADGRLTDVVDLIAKGTHVPIPPGEGRANRSNVNLDGFLNVRDAPGVNRGYAQLFRTGAIEGVFELRAGESFIRGEVVANAIVENIKQYVDVLASLEAGEPLFAMISLIGVQGARMLCGRTLTPGACSQNQVCLPESLLDPSVGVAAALRPAFNVFWNAFGIHPCNMYDANGKWIGAL